MYNKFYIEETCSNASPQNDDDYDINENNKNLTYL
jgi:hypothetical protein